MKTRRIASLPAVLLLLGGASIAFGQIPMSTPQDAGPGVQSGRDAREKAILPLCKQPPPPPRPFPGGAEGGPAPLLPYSYTVKAIPGVIAAGARWQLLWVANGNNADGILGQPDGSILIAQNDRSDVVKLTDTGHASVVYRDTDTGGALFESKNSTLYIGERSLVASIWELAPQRKLFADRLQDGDPLDCTGGGLNDFVVTANGGAYISAGAIYYANPQGVITPQGHGLVFTDGIALSPDEHTLYVTDNVKGTLIAFDVQSDGSLVNQRVIAKMPGGGGDGSTVDSQGRVYVTGYHGVRVFEPSGRYLGTIPAPYDLISSAFAGADKKTLFVVALVRGPGGLIDEIWTIPTIAQGYLGRAK
ncbi:MAG: SMP-30/gluconolactonase/LRE family protein [Steroidobacteraceae bacterium]